MRYHAWVIAFMMLFCIVPATAAKNPWKQGRVTVDIDVEPPDNRVESFLQSHSYAIGNGTDIYCSRGDEYHAPDCSTPPAPHDETSYFLSHATIDFDEGQISLDLVVDRFQESDLETFVEKWEATRERQASGQTRDRKSDSALLPMPERRGQAFPPCTSSTCSFEFKGVFLYQLGKRHKDGIQDITIEFSDELGIQRIHATYAVPAGVGATAL